MSHLQLGDLQPCIALSRRLHTHKTDVVAKGGDGRAAENFEKLIRFGHGLIGYKSAVHGREEVHIAVESGIMSPVAASDERVCEANKRGRNQG